MGSKTRSAGREHLSRAGADLTFTGRGVPVSEDIREQAAHKLARLERLEPRTTRIDLELVASTIRRRTD